VFVARLVVRDHWQESEKLRGYFGELFGWHFDTSSPVAEAVSGPTSYGFIDRATTPDGTGIPGGIGEGIGYTGPRHVGSHETWPTGGR
jgi:hypothetical protein